MKASRVLLLSALIWNCSGQRSSSTRSASASAKGSAIIFVKNGDHNVDGGASLVIPDIKIQASDGEVIGPQQLLAKNGFLLQNIATSASGEWIETRCLGGGAEHEVVALCHEVVLAKKGEEIARLAAPLPKDCRGLSVDLNMLEIGVDYCLDLKICGKKAESEPPEIIYSLEKPACFTAATGVEVPLELVLYIETKDSIGVDIDVDIPQSPGSVPKANSRPELTNPGDQSSYFASFVNLGVNASDGDSDQLTFSATGLPDGLVMDSETGVISGIVAGDLGTSYNATVNVSDGQETVSVSFAWRIIEKQSTGVDYDLVYIRAPRRGDQEQIQWPEIKDPINAEPGSDLMLLHPDGTEQVLVAGGKGAVIDPTPSFDGQWVYYAKFADLSQKKQGIPISGADIFKINVATSKIVQLTQQEWTPNTAAGQWSSASQSGPAGSNYLGYGIFNTGPIPLPGNRIMFTSSRNGYRPNKSYTKPNFQLFVMDDDGNNVELIGHMNLGSALHPTLLKDGRVMFSSYEAQGLRDRRMWGLWAIYPDGRKWEPLMSAFSGGRGFHFQTQLSDERIIFEIYYNQNNGGFGSFLSAPPRPPSGVPPFGSANASDASNPELDLGWYKDGKIRRQRYSFSPVGLAAVTKFASAQDQAAYVDPATGERAGKVTHPSGAPFNDLLLVWSPGPVNRDLNPKIDAGLYLLPQGLPTDSPKDLVLIKNAPGYNEMQPRALVPYREIYGIDEPKEIPFLPNDGQLSPYLPRGTPFAIVGTSSFIKRDTAPGSGPASYDGLDRFYKKSSGNWSVQGADAGKYTDDDIFAVRILAMEPTSDRRYGPSAGDNFQNHAQERLRILAEIPLRKENVPLDPDGNPDTSFATILPADTPFTFQTIDKNGMVLNMAQTWHQLRPGEVRTDCGGCHAHAQRGTDFTATAAGKAGYVPTDAATKTMLLTKDNGGVPTTKTIAVGAVDVEYYRDIKPILQRSCAGCHGKSSPAADLILDDESVIDGYEGTYLRLARDPKGQWGRKPVNGQWDGNDRGINASRYIRKFQSRRSLLIWKIFGQRLDGWSNEDHPTESVPGDLSTFPAGANKDDADLDFVGKMMPPPGNTPLSEDEKLLFVRWVDLGAPANRQDDPERKKLGWFLDELRPVITITSPRPRQNQQSSEIIFGLFDYYSGLDFSSLAVTADFSINGLQKGENLAELFRENEFVWTLDTDSPLPSKGEIVVKVSDNQGNVHSVTRKFAQD